MELMLWIAWSEIYMVHMDYHSVHWNMTKEAESIAISNDDDENDIFCIFLFKPMCL